MFFFSFFFLIILVFLGVGFYVLLERSVLGYIQFRSGPSSVGILGIFQPFSDALKLFSSEFYFLYFGNFFIYYIVPVIGLVVSICFWLTYPLFFNFVSMNLGVFYLLCVSGLGVYFIMMAGWSSNSLYSMIGCLRSVAQSVSYEICFFLLILGLVNFSGGLSFFDFFYIQFYVWLFFVSFPLFFVFFSCVLAETNRSPFDFAEGESELVSGFNLEYGSFMFSFIFLSEYMNMFFMSLFCVLLFFGGDFSSLMFFIKIIFFCFCFIWVRGTFPRYRYDKLMGLSWSVFLPFVLNNFLFFVFVCVVINFIN
nr:NADH dehydrogenase subunit 1 [Borysthenes sp. 1 WQW-2023a]